jgi:hypothetical protein
MRVSFAFVLAILWFVPSGCDPVAYRASSQNEATALTLGKGIGPTPFPWTVEILGSGYSI